MVEARLDELVGKSSARSETKVELSLPPVGVAIRNGAPVPDISRFWRGQGRSPTRTARVACSAADIGFQEVAEILPVKGTTFLGKRLVRFIAIPRDRLEPPKH